ncbi:LruC domain-containing protein [Flagellimonas allohymeniacidonis]|uniref:LruC domain-containing protein n=1 Tax=Flagellimonas allohymeniacidonis TaxID=2517819 RepID=A0A4Q8QMI0_9FLAO|nr:LruC domain-containing protein [Allomuricauda hymeniacidonis]TAI49516.1 LruC domain-containing protein [Allomuricauda hymeniacidonis]
MKTSQIVSLFLGICTIFCLESCVKDSLEEPIETATETENESEEPAPVGELLITDLKIPDGFEFKTEKPLQLVINDNTTGVKYDVYAYRASTAQGQFTYISEEDEEITDTDVIVDNLNHLLFSGVPSGGRIEHSFVVPSYFEKLYIRRKEGFAYSSSIVDIVGNEVTYTHVPSSGKGASSSKSAIEDYLYCVNGSGELFQVDPLNGDYTFISTMPMGSYTAAIDQQNKVLYSIGRSKPNPLMKYDMINDAWTTVANLGIGGPRLDYNTQDGLLYFSTGDKLYTIDPLNGTILSQWVINGLDKKQGGDLAFAEDGTLFLCSFSGLYRLTLNNEGDYDSTRISGEDLPFSPTSMTFDSNNELWLANNGSNSNLIVMDTQTGGWEYRYGPNSNSGVSFGRTINDLTTFRIIDETAVDPDTDGDGITDSNDDFPEDADKAFEQFTPSKYGWGTLAFEDLWPFLGDYDFNDTTINYRFVAILNSDNMAVQLDIHFEVTSDGAGFANAFGIEFESIAPSLVESVTGTVLTEGFINVAANGTEQGQSRAVVILFDNNEAMLNIPSKVSVKFTTPITTNQLGLAPFNPFLIVDEDRGKEIHLPNRFRTSLGINDTEVEGVNQDEDGNYQTGTGLPWAINIIHNFKPPKENVPVNQAYNFFNEWAASGGAAYQDWYKDSVGYRNESELQ